MKKQPWMKWFWSDWRADPLLRSCAPLSRYVWAEMLGLMHEAEPYGHLVINGRAIELATLSRVISVELGDVRRAVKELKDTGVCSVTDDGVIFSRRMIRDKEQAEKNRINGKKGGNPAYVKQGVSNGPVNPPDRPPDKAQKPEARSQKPDKQEQQDGLTSSGAVEAAQAPSLSPAERKRRWEIGMEAYIRKQFPDAVAKPLLEAWMERQPWAVAEVNKLSDERKAAR